MKKIFPYILMFLIFANLFAPLSVEVGKNNTPQINAKIAEASGITVTMSASAIDTEITAKVKVLWEDTSWLSRESVSVTLYGATGIKIEQKNVDLTDAIGGGQEGSATFSGLTPSTQYKVTSFAFQASREWWQLGSPTTTVPQFSVSGKPTPEFITLTTQPTGIKTPTGTGSGTGTQKSINIDSIMPECGIGDSWLTGGGTVYGCAAQLIYYVLFVPTSYLFALAGQFFDWSFGYSVDDDSYRSPFVLNGWGLVRDFCNIFFIFVLLYVAFATILSLHGFKTKEMIINVVIIGLLINFSLFASQVIIDASNILARVFYNSNTIKITEGGANGVTDTTPSLKPGLSGELPISAAIVNKINPQNLIINGATAIELEDTVSGKKGYASKPTTGGSTGAIGAGAFILITLLAIGVNVIGLIVFFSVGLIFIARVIGLWLAMIFVPLAFFSYTVPSMKDMKMVGWKHWWPETLKLAFLAPIFIFFLYLILQFLDTGLGLIDTANKTGAAFVIGTTVPFIFIMVLLWQAKSIAKDLSGTIGQSITGGIAAVGGLALGGAALGAAFLGRQTLGAVAKYTQNDGARKNALNFKDTTTAWEKSKRQWWNPIAHVSTVATAIRGTGKAATALTASGLSKIGRQTDPHTGKTTNVFQREEKKLGEKVHSEHLLDEKAQIFTGNKESKYKDLTEDDQKTVKDRINRDLVSKETHNKIYEKLTQAERATVDAQKGTTNAAGVFVADPNGNFTHAANNAQTSAQARGEHVHTAEDLDKATKVDTATSEFVNALRKGSYDIRNLSQTQAKSKGFLPQFGLAFTSLIASGMRGALKQSNVNYGTGQKDFFKDLGHTITDALKSAQIKADLASHAGVGGKEDSHGGGGHH